MSDNQEPLSPQVREAIAAERAVPRPLPEDLLRRIQGSIEAASSSAPAPAGTPVSPALAGWPVVAVGVLLGGLGGYFIRGAFITPVERTVRVEVPTVVEKRVEVPVIVEKRIEVPVPAPRRPESKKTDVQPAEDKPAPAVKPNRDEQLAQERLVLDRARSAILSSKFADAMAAIREHEQGFPTPLLEEEREYLAIRALASAREVEVAKARFDEFERRWPSSVFLGRLREIVLP